MLTQGTKTKTSVQIAEQIAQLGASLNAASGFGSAVTVITASGLKDNFNDWFALANDILLNPTFPADELNRLKQRQKAQLRQQRTSPTFLSNETFNRVVYGNHPASRISRADESSTHSRRRRSQNGITIDIHRKTACWRSPVTSMHPS